MGAEHRLQLTYLARISFRLEIVELRGFDQRQNGGGTFAALVRSGEEPVLAAVNRRPIFTPYRHPILTPLVADSLAPVRRRSADGILDVVELADPDKRFLGDRMRSGAGGQIEELAADMRPARRLLDGGGFVGLGCFIEVAEPGIAIGMQDAREVCEVGFRMLTLRSGL